MEEPFTLEDSFTGNKKSAFISVHPWQNKKIKPVLHSTGFLMPIIRKNGGHKAACGFIVFKKTFVPSKFWI